MSTEVFIYLYILCIFSWILGYWSVDFRTDKFDKNFKVEGESSQIDKCVPDEGLVKLLNYSYLKNSINKFCNLLDNNQNLKCFPLMFNVNVKNFWKSPV